jgi:hypothetical protein
MAIIEGASFEGYKPYIVAITYTKPSTDQGASLSGYGSKNVIQASVEKNTTKVGAIIEPYAEELALIFGTEDF